MIGMESGPLIGLTMFAIGLCVLFGTLAASAASAVRKKRT